jgi:alpha-L-fucosidase 2
MFLGNRFKDLFSGIFILSLLLTACSNSLGLGAISAQQPDLKLWYDKPATNWMTSALPIGNGELGAMFFGGVTEERIQFNEKTLWTGSTTQRGAYQSFGDVRLTFPGHAAESEYRRELSLDDAIGTVSYRIDSILYRREYFASRPDGVIVMRITTPGSRGKITMSTDMTTEHSASKVISSNMITFRGKLDLLSYEAQLSVLNEGGILVSDDNKITVSGADAITLLLTAATNYDISSSTYVGKTTEELHQYPANRISRATAKPYEALRDNHLKDYQPLFNRVKLALGTGVPEYPTDILLHQHRESRYLDVLYFQYGRYLMLASSRGMDLPNNLQGIWNDNNNPPWQCDIHTNINIQMNYWPAESTNLSECHLPFIRYVATEAGRENGSFRNLARSEGCRGWTVKTQSNIFAYTDWNINRPANAWYGMHLWQHYAYTDDIEYLRKIAFPVLQAACEYWFDRLKEDATGKLVAPNEWSPEQGPWEDGVAYAQQLIWELFNSTLKACDVLDYHAPFTTELKDKFARLDNGLSIGSWGQIKEWKQDTQNIDKPGNRHRHLSQLIALYPGNQISYHLDSLYADAARTTLTSRGDEGTGWSRAWKISCWARLFDGNHAYKLLKAALNPTHITVVSTSNNDGGVYDNLLDAHPPFQIDGNFGATAGIAELLVQSNRGFIQLLPALPSAWPEGNFEGLKAEGNFTIDLAWKAGKPTTCHIHSGSGRLCTVYYPGIAKATISDEEGKEVSVTIKNENEISFPTVKQKVYKIRCI